MIFSCEVPIPANTPLISPVSIVLSVTYGLIYRMEIQFPAGCAGLAGVQGFDGGHQFIPASQGEWFHSDDVTIAFDDCYLKMIPPYELDFKGYNLDDTYPHTIYVRIGMAEKDVFMARFMPSLTYDKILAILKEETELQKIRNAEILETGFGITAPEEMEVVD